jgi:hypothetical protein
VTEQRGRSGKVNGVLTGLREAAHERVVIADDDVRWEPEQLRRVAHLLDHADVVRPQNHFSPLPWHARWDTARMLINRGLGSDFPGTLAVRRSTLLEAGGYDADVLFENLELMRTVRAAGGTVLDAPDLFVRRLPPTFQHFFRQRVRQAYDSSAQPARLVAELALLPALLAALSRYGARAFVGFAALGVAVADRGRRRAAGRTVFPSSSTWLAPVWLIERAVCSWLAVGQRLRGGVPYAGTRFRRSASSPRQLRRRMHAMALERTGASHDRAA